MASSSYYSTPQYLLREIVVPTSIPLVTGSLTIDSSNRLLLSGDSITPGNSMVYGTNSSGVKGWYTAGGSAAWGSITGTLSSQTDLQTALGLKQNSITLTTTGSSGVATLIGSTLNIPQYSGGSSLTIGSTSITSGTTTRILYNNAGTLGEYTVTGSGSVVMSISPALTGVPTISGGTGPYVVPIFATGAALTGNIFIGTGVANVSNQQTSSATHIDNTVIGLDAGKALASDDNTLIGQQAGYLLTTSGRMTFVGSYAGRYMIGAGASESVFLGYAAGGEVGHDTGGAFGTGSNSVLIGGHAGFVNQGPFDNLVLIGTKTGSFSQTTGGSNELSIQNSIFGVANSYVAYSGVGQGRIGLYIMNPTAKLHIVNNTSTTDSFRIDDNTSTLTFSVQNAGTITIAAPSNDNSLTQILARDGSGIIRYRTVASIGGLPTVSTVSGGTTLSITGIEQLVLGDTTSSGFTTVLPTAVGNTGYKFHLKKTVAVNNWTIGTTSSQTIDGATTAIITTQYSAITVISDGANWQII